MFITISSKTWKVNDRVLACVAKDYYLGTVKETSSKTVSVLFDDGDMLTFNQKGENENGYIVGRGISDSHPGSIQKKDISKYMESTVSISSERKYLDGDRVLTWSQADKSFFLGTVTSTDSKQTEVKLDSGDISSFKNSAEWPKNHIKGYGSKKLDPKPIAEDQGYKYLSKQRISV